MKNIGFWGCGWIEAVSAVILLRILCQKVYSFVSDLSRMWCFTYFLFLFDLTIPFQVQPISWKVLWSVYNFDWYPKYPKWSALSRNVSIFVRSSIERSSRQTRTLRRAKQPPKRQLINVSIFVVPVPVFRLHHPSLRRSLEILTWLSSEAFMNYRMCGENRWTKPLRIGI